MSLFASPLRWFSLLGFAIFVPLALPSRGYLNLRRVEIVNKDFSNILVSNKKLKILSSPCKSAPPLRTLNTGTPLRLIRPWISLDGESWAQVEIQSSKLLEFSNPVKRGWINI